MQNRELSTKAELRDRGLQEQCDQFGRKFRVACPRNSHPGGQLFTALPGGECSGLHCAGLLLDGNPRGVLNRWIVRRQMGPGLRHGGRIDAAMKGLELRSQWRVVLGNTPGPDDREGFPARRCAVADIGHAVERRLGLRRPVIKYNVPSGPAAKSVTLSGWPCKNNSRLAGSLHLGARCTASTRPYVQSRTSNA